MSGNCDGNLSNWTCSDNYTCMGPSTTSKCRPCSQLTEGFTCRCDKNFNIQNCRNCKNRTCQSCLNFYTKTPQGACVSNFCSAHTYQCGDGERCPETAVDRSNCEPCQSGQTMKCKCGKKENCSMCKKDGSACTECLSGYDLADGNCVLKGNICDQYKSNSLCEIGFFCENSFGSSCNQCEQVKQGQSCKCSTGDIKNCLICSQSGCEKCLEKYIFTFNKCQLNTCGQVQNTLNCVFGHFCRSGSSPNQECAVCDGSQECNCGAISGCRTCGGEINTCGSCFYGFSLVEKRCVRALNTCGENFDQALCEDDFYCKSKFGDFCSKCTEMTVNSACKCGGADIQNCTKCENGRCVQCVLGYYQLNGKCAPNVCISGQPAEVCAFNNYCPGTSIGAQINCEICHIGQLLQCNCGGPQNCSTCDLTKLACVTCVRGYVKNGDNCVLDSNICDQENKSTLCSTGNYCSGTFGDKCVPCSTITQGLSCFCEGNMLLNCTECEGSLCKVCIQGYLQVAGICQPNFCDNSLSNQMCQMGYICVQNSLPGDSCQLCNIDQTVECNCGVALNCTICGPTPNTCGGCLSGLILDELTNQCISLIPGQANICDSLMTSMGCYDNYFCDGSVSLQCSPCTFIQLGQKCKCDTILQQNCILCQGSKCASCIDGFSPLDGECVINTCGDGQYNCHLSYFCPENAQANTPCQWCDRFTTQPCNCGQAKNCQTCALLPNECATCLKGFILDNNTCIPPIPCDKQTPCPNFNYCNNGICALCDIQNAVCECEGSLNCQKCGFPGSCVSCIHGWKQDIYGNCTIPICTIPPQTNQYCAAPDQNRQCSANQIIIDSMILQCNCGNGVEGCALCLNSGVGCRVCMNGYFMMSGKCIPNDPNYIGSCDSEGESSMCAIGHGCNGFGQCVPCAELPLFHSCKCENDSLVENCSQCDGEKCEICLPGTTLTNEVCEISCSSQMQCFENQMCDDKTKTCHECDGTSPCRCGEAENCVSCGSESSCEICLSNYVKDNHGSCSLCIQGYTIVHTSPLICEKLKEKHELVMSPLDIAGCVVAGVFIISAVYIIIRKVVRKPKRYNFQHNGFK